MKAKDSAMTDLAIIGHISEWVKSGSKDVADLAMSVRDAQAEITWDKAIKEVVDWIHENGIGCISHRDIEEGRTRGGVGLSFIEADWQAKLKEWGLK